MLLAAALLSLPWSGHVDDVDAQLYQVVVRRIAAGDGWFDLRYVAGTYDHFREHLPFGFWPAAAAIRLFGERAVAPLWALFTLGTLALVGWTAARLAGPWAGLCALLLLATCESVWRYGGRLWLDAPLVLFATASAIPVLLPRPRAGSWILAGGLAALAALVKGPFGLLPLPCAALAAAIAYREPRRLAWGAAATLAAAAPALLFLWIDRLHGGSWWRGYGVAQVAASAIGRRTDGQTIRWYPFQVVAGRFWPGLPFAVWAAGWGLRDRAEPARRVALLLTIFSFALLVGLCIPYRKWWNHELVAFPALGLLAGVGAARLLGPWLAARPRAVSAALLGSALLAGTASAAGMGRWLLPSPCVGSREFASALDGLPPGSPILVVSRSVDWATIAGLAAERRLSPWPVPGVPARPRLAHGTEIEEARVALAHDGDPVAPPWRVVQAARGWLLLERP